MKAINLRTEHMQNPLGLQTSRPVLSWCCEGGTLQTAFEIAAYVGDECVWNSGKTPGSTMRTLYGLDARPREKVRWQVRLWDENDVAGQWSEAGFEMGLVDGAGWQAKWIDPELPHDEKTRQPASVLCAAFVVESTENARLYITCHGLYAAYINGQRVGDFVLAPGTDDYHKRLQYQVYDVSPMLAIGDNEITVTLGDGWYRGNIGVDGLYNYYGSDLALLCQLEIDGETVLVSDERWQASQNGPVRLNDLQKGEEYDACLEQITGWHNVTVRDFGYGNLVCSDSVPVKEQERFEGKLLKTPNGDTVVDFGQNLAGYTEIKIVAHEGQKITLRHGETLDDAGNFTQANFEPGERNKNGGVPQRIDYVCKEGMNIYKPSFAIFGFRYAKVETNADLSAAQFTAIAVYSEMPQVGFFESANPDVNRLFLNSLWSMRSNFCDIPTDCPTRERAGWTGDAGAFAPTGVYLCDCWPIFRKWLAECRLAQGKDGLVQNIAPVNNGGSIISNMLQGSSGWGDACVLVPWAMYQAYGDTSILKENYEMMKKWVLFVEKRASKTRRANRKNPYKKYLVDKGFHFGEWVEPDVDNVVSMKNTMAHGAPEVATAYYFKSASILGRVAQILGKTEDAKRFADVAEGARKAYRFTCTKDGEITSARQCEYVRSISFGLLDATEIQAASDGLAALVKRCGYHLNTGFLSTPHLCFALADNGHVETAYKLLLQDGCPGWLYPVKHGATTIWEAWDGVREDGTVHDSFNHYTFGAISGWLFGGVCGICLEAEKLTLCPKPSRLLGSASARWDSPVGTIESSWRYEENKLVFVFAVPANVRADIVLPNGQRESVCAGKYRYEIGG